MKNNTYRWLIRILMIAVISTTTNVFTLGASWLWPMAFGIGFVISGYFYGKWLDENNQKAEVK